MVGRRGAVLLVVAGLLLGGTPTVAHADSVEAVGRWAMVPQAKDRNGDGVIDGDGGVPRRGAMSAQPSERYVGAGNGVAQPHERLIDGSLSWYLDPDGFPVRLSACGSTGREYRWIIGPQSGEARALDWRPLRPGSCARTVVLREGRVGLTLQVRGDGGRAETTLAADVRNILVLAMGDSYASGEGNPRNVEAWLAGGGPFRPYWDDDACNRSARSAPAQAALALERSSPTTSVTLVDVTCSGAGITRGVLGRQAGTPASQVERARALLGDRPVDLVTLSVGGNDVGFGSLLQTCVLASACPLARATSAPLDAFRTVQDGLQSLTGGLPDGYRRVAACLGGPDCALADGRRVPPIALADDAQVLPTLYPDITRSAAGQPCTYLTIPALDFAWARGTILDPRPVNPYPYPLSASRTVDLPMPSGSLNAVIATTANLPRWRPVSGTWAASGESATGHGVCAGAAAWVYGVTALSGFPEASFHPNVPGTAVLARELGQAMARAAAEATRGG